MIPNNIKYHIFSVVFPLVLSLLLLFYLKKCNKDDSVSNAIVVSIVATLITNSMFFPLYTGFMDLANEHLNSNVGNVSYEQLLKKTFQEIEHNSYYEEVIKNSDINISIVEKAGEIYYGSPENPERDLKNLEGRYLSNIQVYIINCATGTIEDKLISGDKGVVQYKASNGMKFCCVVQDPMYRFYVSNIYQVDEFVSDENSNEQPKDIKICLERQDGIYTQEFYIETFARDTSRYQNMKYVLANSSVNIFLIDRLGTIDKYQPPIAIDTDGFGKLVDEGRQCYFRLNSGYDMFIYPNFEDIHYNDNVNIYSDEHGQLYQTIGFITGEKKSLIFEYDGERLHLDSIDKMLEEIDFRVELTVRKAGTEKWTTSVTADIGDEVEFQIQYKNISNILQNDVAIRTVLPNNLEYIPSSTILYNSVYPNGVTIRDDYIVQEGIRIGNYKPGINAYVRFSARVVNNSLSPGCNALIDWARGSVYGITLQDYSTVAVEYGGD